MKYTAYIIVIGLSTLLFSVHQPKPETSCIINVVKSYCKVSVEYIKDNQISYSAASGWIVEEDKDNYYIFTAGHAIKKDSIIKVRFYYPKATKYYPVKVVDYVYEKESHKDMAILKLQKQDNLNPPILRLSNFPPAIDSRIITYGGPGGNYPTMVFGYIYGIDENNIYYRPKAKAGRSGSPVLDEKGSVVYGIVLTENGRSVKSKHIKQFLEQTLNK